MLAARTYNATPTGLKATVIETAVTVEISRKAETFILKSSIHGVFSLLFISCIICCTAR